MLIMFDFFFLIIFFYFLNILLLNFNSYMCEQHDSWLQHAHLNAALLPSFQLHDADK